ncbi:hypothetical protein ABZV68_22840 [Streptomyces clavifer]|uniref:hypothetical protein n=2 Tax=Streptomyces clavifer TaxID=68188 RepID=UPI0033B5E02D
MTVAPQNPHPSAPVTASWVVATLLVLVAGFGLVLCVGAAALVWARPGAVGPLTAALSVGAFLVGLAALVVSVLGRR